MKTDIQIAQEAKLQPIREVAASLGISEDDLELYGKYKDIFAINKHIDNKNKLTRNFVNTDYFKLYVNLIHSSINI